MNKRQFAIRIETDLRTLFKKDRRGDSRLFQADSIINNMFLTSLISLQKRKISENDINEYVETFDVTGNIENNEKEDEIITKMYNRYVELYK